AGLLEMNEVAHVHQIERTVAEDDRLVAMPLANRRKLRDGDDLVLLPERRRRRLDHRLLARTVALAGVDADSSARSSRSVRATSTKFFQRNALLSPCFRSMRPIGTSR